MNRLRARAPALAERAFAVEPCVVLGWAVWTATALRVPRFRKARRAEYLSIALDRGGRCGINTRIRLMISCCISLTNRGWNVVTRPGLGLEVRQVEASEAARGEGEEGLVSEVMNRLLMSLFNI